MCYSGTTMKTNFKKDFDIEKARRALKLVPWETVRAKLFEDPEVRKEYEKQEVVFSVVRAIIKERAQKKLTQKQLAQKMGITQSALARFESGRVNPTIYTIQNILASVGLKLKVTKA